MIAATSILNVAFVCRFRGWAGHLDGVWNGGHPAPQASDDPKFDEDLFVNGQRGVNGCQQVVGPGLNLGHYTCLVGVTLSDQSIEGSGNLGLLKGAHHRMIEFFRKQKEMGSPLGPGGWGWPRFGARDFTRLICLLLNRNLLEFLLKRADYVHQITMLRMGGAFDTTLILCAKVSSKKQSTQPMGNAGQSRRRSC